jgi:hypothetical protein
MCDSSENDDSLKAYRFRGSRHIFSANEELSRRFAVDSLFSGKVFKTNSSVNLKVNVMILILLLIGAVAAEPK